MEPTVIFAVLRELGVLFEAAGSSHAEPEPELTAGGEHVLYEHTPLWDYEFPAFVQPFGPKGEPKPGTTAEPGAGPLYKTLPPGSTVEQALQQTRLVVFLGAVNTAALQRALETPGCLTLVFDRDPGRVARFASQIGPTKLAWRAHIFLGEPEDYVPPLGMVLPGALFQSGFPVFFALPELLARGRADAARVVQLLELLFYRYMIYPMTGQAHRRGLPLRPMARGLFFDQQLHMYANAPDYFRHPDIQPLRKAFLGETAILVAAGPDLQDKLDYLRSVRDRAVVIAVNNALKPLLAAGIRPHYVVANDTSVMTSLSFEGLPRLDDIALVAHCLAPLGGGVLPRKFLFGNCLPELYGTRPNLRLHGSVITTAFALARHMGCARCVFIGAQLCSRDPWSLSYAKNSIHEAAFSETRPLTNAYPQLYPVPGTSDPALYTSLNFLDAAQWLLDEIRSSGVACLNTTRESLLFGAGIVYDPAPEVPVSGQLVRRLARVGAARITPRDTAPALQALESDLHSWRIIAQDAEHRLVLEGEEFLESAQEALRLFDGNNVSYLVQRYGDFDNSLLHYAVFLNSHDRSYMGLQLRSYLDHIRRMALEFVQTLERSIAAIRSLGH